MCSSLFQCSYQLFTQKKNFTPPRNRGGIIFSLQFVCVCVCVSVCISVCPAVLVNKIPAEQMNRFGRGFRYLVASYTGSDPIEFGDLGSKVKVTVTQYLFFLHNSLLSSLLCISALLCLTKIKFGMSL